MRKVRWAGALFIGKCRATERTNLEVQGPWFERVMELKVREGEGRREMLFPRLCGETTQETRKTHESIRLRPGLNLQGQKGVRLHKWGQIAGAPARG